MRNSLAFAAVWALSLTTSAAAQTEAEPAGENAPAQAAELPPAPPASTATPAAEPEPGAGETQSGETTRVAPAEPERQEPAADRGQPDLPLNAWDTRFGARFDVDADGRFVVRSVVDEGLAAQTGLRAGDVILSVDGQTFDTEADLRSYLRSHADDRIPMTVLRDGAEQTVHLHNGGDGGAARPALGVRFVRGPFLEIIDVVEGSPADQAGIVPGDRIVSMNGDQFASTDAFLSAVAHADVDDDIELVLNRHGEIIVATPRLDVWDVVFDSPGTTVTTLRPDLDADDVDVITPGHAHVHSAACGCGYPYYWSGYRYPYWTYAGPYFYAPYSGPIYYGPAYSYWPAYTTWRYPIYSAWVW